MIEHLSPISGVATYNNQYILTAGYDNKVILWDAKTKQALSRGLHDHLVNQCCFSPCGQFAATSSSDYSVRVWRLPDMELQYLLTGHLDDVEGMAFHPEKPLIATCSRDKSICLFNTNGEFLTRLEGHSADVISIVWEGNSDILVSSSDDGTIKRWDTSKDSDCLIENIDLEGVETDTVVISRAGIIYAGNDEGNIIALVEGAKSLIDAHNAGIKRLVYDEAGNKLISLSYDRVVKLWDCDEKGSIIEEHIAELPNIVWPRSCAVLNSKNIVFASFGSSYAQYNIETQTWSLEHINSTQGINGLCGYQGSIYTVGDAGKVCKDFVELNELPSLCNFIVPFNGVILTGGQTGQVFNALTGEVLHQHRSPLNCATLFSRNGKQCLMVGSYTGEGLLFTLDQDSLPAFEKEIKLHQNAIKGICCSENEIFSVCADYAVARHAIDTLTEKSYIANAHDKIANDCACAKALFVSVSRDLKIRLWLEDNVETIKTPHKNSIKCVAISDDSEYIASGDYRGYVSIYHRPTNKWVAWHHPTSSGISSLIFVPGHNHFVASSYDGCIHVMECEENPTTESEAA